MNPTRLRIRQAQTRMGEAREPTELSLQSMLETANRILTFQLHSPDLVLDEWTLYQRLVTPTRSPLSPRGTPES